MIVPRMVRGRRAPRVALLVLLGVGAVYGLAYAAAVIASLQTPAVYNKDFVQEYLLARAFLDPARPDPYVPIRDLAARYLSVVGYGVKEYPTPHPPSVGVLFMPLALLEYPTAAALWLGVQVASLATAIFLLARAHGRHLGPMAVFGLTAVAIGWHPVHLDLGLGQLMLVLLALLVGARLALLRGRSVLAGLLLGLAILVKVVPWPILVLLVVGRAWRAAAVCLGTMFVGLLLVGLTAGFGTVIEYVARVAPLLTTYFRDDPANQSLWTLGPRLLLLLGYPERTGLVVALASLAAPAVVLVAALAWARFRLDLDSAVGVALCAGVLVSPIAWEMYLVLALIPAAQLCQTLTRCRSSTRVVLVSLASLLLLLVEWEQWVELGRLLAWVPGSALLSLGPAAAVLAVGSSLAIVARSESRGSARCRSVLPVALSKARGSRRRTPRHA